MKKTRKPEQQGSAPATVRPRLVKAGDLAAKAAADAVKAERKIEAQAKAPAVNPALNRKPRSAAEARDMFNALFNEAA